MSGRRPNGHSDLPVRSPDFFIFGCERSGTTLLCALLSEHPEICVLNDTFAYNILNQQGQARRTQLALKALSKATGNVSLLSRAESSHLPPIDETVTVEVAAEYLDDLVARYRRRAEDNWLGQYAERLEQAGSDGIKAAETYRQLVNSVLTALVPDDQRHKPLLGEKTPIHSHMQEWLRAGFPSARTVVLVRHPITNVAAIFKRLRSRDPLRDAIRTYRSYYEVALKDLVQTKVPGVTIVRYEDLVAAPQDTVGHLAKVLGGTDAPMADTFHYYVKESYVGDRVEPTRDLELRDLLDDRQQRQVLSDCAAIVDRFYLV